jgi:drug/metabolite transporter (DMT)-like permease
MFATFATLLRFWRIAPIRAVVVISVIALVELPVHWLFFGFERIYAVGLVENLLQVIVQGVLAGAGATYLFTRSIVLLGAGRGAVFPSLVPGFTMLLGVLALGEMPSLGQVAGFGIVMLGFWLAQRNPYAKALR